MAAWSMVSGIRMRALAGVLAVCGASAVAPGCATIVKGTTEDVTVTSTPGDADIYVDGRKMGRTPTTLKLSHDIHHVLVSKPGYEEEADVVTESFSGWTLFGIFPLLGGIIIDAITGAITTLDDDWLEFRLRPVGSSGRGGQQEQQQQQQQTTVVVPQMVPMIMPGAAATAPAPAPTPADAPGCAKDADCKGDRVCEAGKCVAPR